MATSKIDRVRKALRLGKGSNGSGDDATAGTIKTVEKMEFSTDNLVPLINDFAALAMPGAQQALKLDGDLSIQITLTLDGEIGAQNDKNDLFRDHVTKIATPLLSIHGPELRPYVDKMIEVLEILNADPGKAPPQDKVTRAYEAICAGIGKELSTKLEGLVNQYMASNKAIKAAYRRYQVKCVHDVLIDVLVIASSIGVTAASWGATGPVAVVAIVRSTIGLGVKLGEMAMSAGQTIGVIEAYFTAVGSLMTVLDNNEGKAEAARSNASAAFAKNTAIETAMGAIAGITNLPIPSVSKIGELLGTLENKLKGLHVSMLNMGKEMTKTRKRAERYAAKIGERTKSDPKFNSKGHLELVQECMASHAKMKAGADQLFEKISAYLGRQGAFQSQLQLYKSSQAKWSRGSSKLFGFATSLGLGLGSSGSGAEFGLTVFNEIGQLVESKLANKAAALS